MNEINELDNKYLVMKWDEVRNNLSLSQRRKLVSILQYNDICRELEGKKENNYVVLNQNDEIDLEQLVFVIQEKYHKLGKPGLYNVKVEKLAIDLVNAILIVGNSK